VNTTINKQILTIRETAKAYGVAEFAVRNWTKAGAFPVLKAGSRCYINRNVFEQFLTKGGEVCNEKR
jgi:hypothetical protein